MIFSRRRNDNVPDTGPVYLTQVGLDNLKKKLARLKESVPRLAEEARRTAAFGDRSDNAEYKEAKGALRSAHSQIIGTEDKLRRAADIAPDKNSGVIQIGSTIVLKSAGAEKTYEIVGPMETNPGSGRISNKSPLGEAILGKKIGDKILIQTPGGEKEYIVTRIT
jgi:transcription elongation factor GreA